ncbi:HXXEE domain-containing protein [Neobacillus sp. LXY-4]|uniref:HXXEE domain-containing protein n=1 Tax=Neobacillus sp. LXY-4 TaxID=3379826 RepID=UPI003EDFFBB9
MSSIDDQHLKLNRFIWLFPVLFLIHDIEEIVTIEKFLSVHSDVIPIKITAIEFTVAFIMLWLIAFFGCFQSAKQRPFLGMRPITFFSFLVPGILLANGIGHVFQFIFFQSYVPGVFTSVIIIFPYSFVSLKFLLKEELLTIKRFWIFLLVGFISQGPLAASALLISKVMFHYLT